jgi:hypothetical protein
LDLIIHQHRKYDKDDTESEDEDSNTKKKKKDSNKKKIDWQWKGDQGWQSYDNATQKIIEDTYQQNNKCTLLYNFTRELRFYEYDFHFT